MQSYDNAAALLMLARSTERRRFSTKVVAAASLPAASTRSRRAAPQVPLMSLTVGSELSNRPYAILQSWGEDAAGWGPVLSALEYC